MTDNGSAYHLIHGDCMDELPNLEPGSVAMVLADPPFGTTHNAWDVRLDLSRLWPHLWRACRKSAAIQWRGQIGTCDAYVKDGKVVITNADFDFVTAFQEQEGGNERLNNARSKR